MFKSYIGLGVMPDEAMVSFIYRVLRRNGYRCFYTIITSDGWGSEPSVPLPAQIAFGSFERNSLLKLYEKTFQNKPTDSIFSNPISHLKSFELTFFPKYHKKTCGSPIPIRLCVECIKEQIQNLGFYYFKHSWLLGSRCRKHDIDLDVISAQKFLQNTSELIQKVKDEQNVCRLTNDSLFLDAGSHSYEKARLAPCIQLLISKFLYKKSDHYEEGYAEVVDYGLLSQYQRSSLSNENQLKSAYFSTDSYLESLIEKFYTELMDLLYEHMEFYFFPINGLKCKAYIGRLKGQNCTLCRLAPFGLSGECPVTEQLQIHRDKSHVRKSMISHYNYCDKWIYRMNKSIERHQYEIGVSEGEKRVLRELHCFKTALRFERRKPFTR
ncbi:hypothetical protein [Vibrio jasicida]|uniref:hypothetical protein n=1 Tax=Vibrio jasicida TaxID=766224 RepID=UPI00039A6D59|nr:hypothetical protein [Vibrio jasicida]